MNLIDVHTHFFPDDMKSNRIKYCKIDANFNQLYANDNVQICTEDDLKMILDDNSNLKIVIQSIGYTDYELTKYTNDFLIELSHKYSQVKTLGSINPAWGEGKSVDELKRIKKLGISGIGELHPDIQGFNLLDFNLMNPIVDYMVENKMIFSVHSSEPVGHIYNGKGKMYPSILYSFALQYPELKIIFAHLGGGLPIYFLMPEVSKELNNVYFDTAAIDFLYDSSIVKIFKQILGDNKILFGSDYGLINLYRAVDNIKKSDLDTNNLNNIFYNNAKQLFSW
tara:strand:- start:800 stop:1642 length:843 start_codon:yes stop_codon:yes gene_type:complete